MTLSLLTVDEITYSCDLRLNNTTKKTNTEKKLVFLHELANAKRPFAIIL